MKKKGRLFHPGEGRWPRPRYSRSRGARVTGEYEKQVKAIGRRHDAEIRSMESQGGEAGFSRVEGSRLHEKIRTPFDEGIGKA